jgi:hypothetical protein
MPRGCDAPSPMSWKPFVATLAVLWLLALGLLLVRPWEYGAQDSAPRDLTASDDGLGPGENPSLDPQPSGSGTGSISPLPENPAGAQGQPAGAVEIGSKSIAGDPAEDPTEPPQGLDSNLSEAPPNPAVLTTSAETPPAPPGPAPSLDKFRRRLLEEIWEPLGEASERYDKHERLPKSRWFGEDQESNQASIDELLDQAIGALELSGLNETRGKLRAARSSIEELRQQNASDREKRLSAQSEAELTRIGKVLELSREDLEERITERELDIADQERQIVELEQAFVAGLRDLGLEVTLESARSLLGTVSGEDFVEMCVAFDNVRLVTEQLETLTREAGESLDLARRYYGSYVVLIRILDRIQDDFVRRVRAEQLPRLAEFAERARKNIQEAERAAVEAQNKSLDLRLRDAINTYKTVDLSSQVTELLREGERNFRALLELDLPTLEGFQNVELEREYRRLTEQLAEP